MAYREEDGQVILTMSREDYQFFNFLVRREGLAYLPDQTCNFLNRLNEGNPHYTPYRIEEKKP